MDCVTADLDCQFRELYVGWRELIQAIDSDSLYRRNVCAPKVASLSGGEHILKSARIVEQTFGGITANLWDDPFEWTLPEVLLTPEKVLDYLAEVEATRQRGFHLINQDEDLSKTIMTARGETQLLSLLADTLVRAGHHLLCAKEIVRRRPEGEFDLDR